MKENKELDKLRLSNNLISLKKIKEDKTNIRQIYDGVEELAQSIKEHGQMRPIEIDQHNIITDGHRRYRALKKLKRDVAWVVIIPVKSQAEKKIRQYSHEAHDRKVTTFERDHAWVKLQDKLHLTAEQFGKKMGVCKTYIDDVRDRVRMNFPAELIEKAGVTLIKKSNGTSRANRIKLLTAAVKYGWENHAFGYMATRYDKLHTKVQKSLLNDELTLKDAIKMSDLPHDDQLSKMGVLTQLTEIRDNFTDVVETKRKDMVAPGRRTPEVKASESLVKLTQRLFDVVHSTELAMGVCKMLKVGIDAGGELDKEINKNIKSIVKLSQVNMHKLSAEMRELEEVL